MTKLRHLCIERRILGVLLLTMGLMAMPAMGDHPACAPGAGDCCSDTGSPGCDDPVCCHDVCTDDPFCCDVTWDSICAGTAVVLCPNLCVGGCDCPDGALEEGEDCGTDNNGGCNSVPNVFTDASCGDTFCGVAWADGGTRDTDWYLVSVGDDGSGTATITATLNSEFNGVVFIVDGIANCAPAVVGQTGASVNCAPGVATALVNAPGTYVVFVANAGFEGNPCGAGNGYTLAIDKCEPPVPPAPKCPSDLDGDGSVGTSDLLELFANWGLCPK